MAADKPARVGMSDAQLAEIRMHNGKYGLGDATDIIDELLAEVERLHEEEALVAAMREFTAKIKKLALRLFVTMTFGVIAGIVGSHLAAWPWSALGSATSGLLAGAALGAYWGWKDARHADAGEPS